MHTKCSVSQGPRGGNALGVLQLLLLLQALPALGLPPLRFRGLGLQRCIHACPVSSQGGTRLFQRAHVLTVCSLSGRQHRGQRHGLLLGGGDTVGTVHPLDVQ